MEAGSGPGSDTLTGSGLIHFCRDADRRRRSDHCLSDVLRTHGRIGKPAIHLGRRPGDHIVPFYQRSAADAFGVPVLQSHRLERAEGAERAEPLAVLSQGAADQLAMAVRMAVLERIGGEVVLPMLVDDALLTWDHDRRERIAAALREAAAQRQIVLASHDPAFLAWGRPVVASCGDAARALTPAPP